MILRVIKAKNGNETAELVFNITGTADVCGHLKLRDTGGIEWRNGDPKKQLTGLGWWRSLDDVKRKECLAIVDQYMARNQAVFELPILVYEEP